MSSSIRTDQQSSQSGVRDAEHLVPLLYEELYRLAQFKMRDEFSGHTLQATALLNEAYVRLTAGSSGFQWNSRGHFYSAAAEAMRRILVEHARRKRAKKRGGDARQTVVDEFIESNVEPVDLLELQDALDALSQQAPRKAEVVKLRFFGGLTMKQVAESLDIAESTADADWAFARAWLKVTLRSD